MSSVIYYPGYAQLQVGDNLTWQVISAITQANPCVVTTVNNNGYVPGMNVSFLIPNQFGMQQLNGKNIQVTQANGNTLTLNIDSTQFSPFAYPSPLPNAYSPPTVFPNSSGPYLPPQPLSYGNQDSFEGTIYNIGEI